MQEGPYRGFSGRFRGLGGLPETCHKGTSVTRVTLARVHQNRPPAGRLYPVTDYVEDCGYVTAYPVRPGYGSTIHKLQGAELEHIAVYLDIPDAKAAGYVAVSRVQRDRDYLLGGVLKRRHFKPAM